MGIASNIRKLREDRGLTQEQVAMALNVSSAAISQWETGVSVPRMGNIEKLAALFRVKKSDIVDERFTYSTVRIPDEMEMALVEVFRQLDAVQKQTVLDVARGLAGVAKNQNIEQVG